MGELFPVFFQCFYYFRFYIDLSSHLELVYVKDQKKDLILIFHVPVHLLTRYL